MIRFSPLLLVAILSGCGAETIGSAGVAGKAAQENAEQARQMQDNVTDTLNTAAQLEQQRLNEAMRESTQ
jgi:hypothetical protein